MAKVIPALLGSIAIVAALTACGGGGGEQPHTTAFSANLAEP